MDSRPSNTAHIRPMAMNRDLRIVADLIESSFALQNDVDGQAFLKQMRQAAKVSGLFNEAEFWPAPVSITPPGFVWDEDGMILGNVSIIPFNHHGQRVNLIANVAVMPAHRRKGIARALTQHAIAYLHKQQQSDIWLQVNQNNSGALDLYRGLGFLEQCCRSTWHRASDRKPKVADFNPANPILRKRRRDEWNLQQKLLERIYPDNIIWHYPVWMADFSPQVWWNPERWGSALKLRHWTLQVGDAAAGFITWQRTDSFADTLWLAPDPNLEQGSIISGLLNSLPLQVGRSKPVAVDLPCGSCNVELTNANFSLFRSLVWMKLPG
jgi:GNAT superfamily N-acetyltransferase